MINYDSFEPYTGQFYSLEFNSNMVIPGNDPRHNFFLSNHELQKTYMVQIFLNGNTSYFIEGSIYHLSPGDIVFLNLSENRNFIHHSPTQFTRINLSIMADFFEQPGFKKYRMIFTQRNNGVGNHIPYNSEVNQRLEECMKQMISHINEVPQQDSVIYQDFLEFLRLLNTHTLKTTKSIARANARRVVNYIDEHFAEDITLDSISKHFFISKTDLCHSFKRYVGYTVTQYITKKRVSMVVNLRQLGMPVMAAAESAGFKSYSSFYRAYNAMTGNKPSDIVINTENFTI